MTLSRRGILAALFSPLVARRSRPVAFSNEITGGQGALVRPAIKSPNYSPGVSGWTIDRDGSAEFNNLTIRGTFNGTDYMIIGAGMFFYSGTPATGNLIASIAPKPGVDAYGNPFVAGITSQSGSVAADIFATLFQGNLFLGQLDGTATPDLANAAAVFASPTVAALTLQTPKTATLVNKAQYLAHSGTDSAGSGPTLRLSDTDSVADLILTLFGHAVISGRETGQIPLTVNAPVGQSADLLDLQVNGSTKLSVDASGNLTAVGTVAGITTGHAQDTANSTTTSTVYAASSVALSTSIVLGPSGKFVASMLVRCDNTGTNNTLSGMLITGSVSGTIMNPTDATSIQWNQTTSAGPFETRQFHTGTPGETITVTAQHRVTTGTGTFRYRDILVQSLPV